MKTKEIDNTLFQSGVESQKRPASAPTLKATRISRSSIPSRGSDLTRTPKTTIMDLRRLAREQFRESLEKLAPDNLRVIVANINPEYDSGFASWIIKHCNYFPLYWDLDHNLFHLLLRHPKLANSLKLEISQMYAPMNKRRAGEGEITCLTAVVTGDDACVKGLLAAGVDPNMKDRFSTTLLHFASTYSKPKCIKAILSFPGVDVNAISNRLDRTPLHEAIFTDCVECIKLLLAAPGMDVNAKDKDGHTPLHIAAKYGKIQSLKTLLSDDRTDINAKTTLGESALDIAKSKDRSNSHREIIKLLEEKMEETKTGGQIIKNKKKTTRHTKKK